MVELKQTKLSDRSTEGRVWDSEFEGYRIDSRNRQIFATSENSKIYFSNIIQIICYIEILICLIIFVNNIDLLQVVLIYSLMSLNVLILRSKNSLQTDCIISRFEYTVSLYIYLLYIFLSFQDPSSENQDSFVNDFIGYLNIEIVSLLRVNYGNYKPKSLQRQFAVGALCL